MGLLGLFTFQSVYWFFVWVHGGPIRGPFPNFSFAGWSRSRDYFTGLDPGALLHFSGLAMDLVRAHMGQCEVHLPDWSVLHGYQGRELLHGPRSLCPSLQTQCHHLCLGLGPSFKLFYVSARAHARPMRGPCKTQMRPLYYPQEAYLKTIMAHAILKVHARPTF